MPCSIAACSTVFPFSTASCRPSIVRLTVSISYRSYNHLKPGRQRSSLLSSLPPFPQREALDERTSAPARIRPRMGRRGGLSCSHARRGVDDLRSEEPRLNSSHLVTSYAVFCLKKKKDTSTLCWSISSV